MKTKDLQIDPSRTHLPSTGFYVRARKDLKTYGSYDISHLTRESLTQWLREGGTNEFGLTVILALLGHTR